MDENNLDKWYVNNLVCPLDKSELIYKNDSLVCKKNYHKYLVYKNTPIMLVDEYMSVESNFSKKSLSIIKNNKINETYFGIEDDYVDKHVQKNVSATNSNFYKSLVGKLKKYPIPNFPITKNSGLNLLDVGCGWGRWTIASNNSGFNSVGLDPSIESILAAKRVSKQLGKNIRFIVGDACYLPFKENTFDNCFSYSVVQHFSKLEALKTLEEIKYVLKPNGYSQIQMLNKHGLRSAYVRIKHFLFKKKYFDTTYYSPKELIQMFENKIGKTNIEVASFFTQAQITEYDLFPFWNKLIFKLSSYLNNKSQTLDFLKKFADNFYIISKK